MSETEYKAQMAKVYEYLRKVGPADREQIRKATGVPPETLRRAAASVDLSNVYGLYSFPMQTSFDSPDGEDI
jgi:hypothetical protein